MSKNAIGTFLAAPLASAHPSLKYIACFGAGSLSALSMAPANLWPALFIGLGTLSLLLLQTARSRFQAFAFGWLFGFGYFLFGLSWIGNALLVEGNPYRWAWPLAVSGLPALLAFFPALATLASFAFLNLKRLSGALGFIALMSFSEWLRGHIFTGFPWNLYGYTWVESLPLIQCVSFGSIYLLTMLTLLWACTPGLLLALPRKEGALLAFLALGTFAACFSFGLWRLNTVHIQDREDVSVKLVQPNIVQSEKWNPRLINRHFETLLTLSQAQDTDTAPLTLIIWPETAISHFFTADPIAMRRVSAMLSTYSGNAYILTGLLQRDPETGAFSNALVMIDKTGMITNIYKKHHLVPFGEYIPFQRYIPLKPIAAFTGFEEGTGPQIQTIPDGTPNGLRYSPLVCYEVIFPGAVVPHGQPRPDFIVNVTNDGWYGDSAGPYQHLTQAVFRAVEEGVPVLRAANTGISAVITPLGTVRYRSILLSETTETLPLPESFSGYTP